LRFGKAEEIIRHATLVSVRHRTGKIRHFLNA
jgi:hypothetical protein